MAWDIRQLYEGNKECLLLLAIGTFTGIVLTVIASAIAILLAAVVFMYFAYLLLDKSGALKHGSKKPTNPDLRVAAEEPSL